MKKYIYFGETVKGYDIPVLNERELRAGAGILFLFAMISFLNAYLVQNYFPLRIFITAFFIDFVIRVFINPKFSPSLVLGRFFVSGQKPEYVGAAQKKFAWVLGLILSGTMFYLSVISQNVGIINLIICLTCLPLLFFETSFGICVGCKLYNLFHKEKAKLCPGGACELKTKEAIQKISWIQWGIVVLFVVFLFFLPKISLFEKNEKAHVAASNEESCTVSKILDNLKGE